MSRVCACDGELAWCVTSATSSVYSSAPDGGVVLCADGVVLCTGGIVLPEEGTSARNEAGALDREGGFLGVEVFRLGDGGGILGAGGTFLGDEEAVIPLVAQPHAAGHEVRACSVSLPSPVSELRSSALLARSTSRGRRLFGAGASLRGDGPHLGDERAGSRVLPPCPSGDPVARAAREIAARWYPLAPRRSAALLARRPHSQHRW